MALLNYFLLFISTVIAYSCVQCKEFVPVYMWGTEKTSEYVPALHKISEDSFKDSILEYLKLKSNPYLVVFAEKTLSPEDFAQRNSNGESAFKNIQELKDQKNYISYRPYVQNPIGAIQQVKPVTHTSIETILNNIDVPKDHVWVINLDDARDDESRFHMLQRHDSDIVSIYHDIIKKHSNVIALYTANHTSWVAPEVEHRSRNLLQKDDNPVLFNKTDIVLYISKSGEIRHKEKPDTPVSITDSWEQKGGNSTLTLHSGENNITFILSDLKTPGYWSISSIEVNQEKLKIMSDPYAPYGFSYHCATFNFSNAAKTLFLSLPGFQIQTLTNKTDSFGDAYDCTGFTSIPIWSGIFVSAILLLIITFGLIMMMDIKTMDRFDDPKGKTITVTAE